MERSNFVLNCSNSNSQIFFGAFVGCPTLFPIDWNLTKSCQIWSSSSLEFYTQDLSNQNYYTIV